MSAHTPGPWHVRLHDAKSFNGASIEDSAGVTIASIPRKADRPYDQKGADASLIAVAPHLLAMLKKLVSVALGVRANNTSEYMEYLTQTIQAADRAIAKAESEGLAPARGSAPS